LDLSFSGRSFLDRLACRYKNFSGSGDSLARHRNRLDICGGERIFLWLSQQNIPIRKKFGVLEASDVKKLRSLEAENARLKRMLAEREMAIDTLKEINRRKW
jgi:hypothetical protein